MSKIFRYTLIAIVGIVLIGAVAIWWNFKAGRVSTPPAPPAIQQVPENSGNVSIQPSALPPYPSPVVEQPLPKVEPIVTLARNLEIPWGLDFLPDGSIIFTERPGRIRLIDSSGTLVTEPLLAISA